MVQVAEGADQGFLHDLLAEVAVAADAVEAEAVQRLQQGVGHGLDGGGVPAEGTRAPGGVEEWSQAGPPFRPPVGGSERGNSDPALTAVRRPAAPGFLCRSM